MLFFVAAYEAYVAAKIIIQKTAIDRYLSKIACGKNGMLTDHINLRAESSFFTLLRKKVPDEVSGWIVSLISKGKKSWIGLKCGFV